jgi:hypothetical protein
MPIKKIVNRVKTVAREARDVPTAWATSAAASDDYKAKSPSTEAQLKKTINQASRNWDKQLQEVAAAILRGDKGTSSGQVGKPGQYTKGQKR